MDYSDILVTGGSGLLGSELKKHLTGASFPPSGDFDITDYGMMSGWLRSWGKKFSLLLHCAAFTSPPRIDKEPEKGIDVNIIGTAHVVKLCHAYNMKLVYISTDYIFDGSKGNYSEEDAVSPVNKYAWSKFGGECSVRLYDNSLIIRLSFGPDIFPYEAAFIDQWTSREPVSLIAKKITAVVRWDETGIIHLGGRRKTVYEYAKELNPQKEIKQLKRDEVSFVVPEDTSLHTDKYEKLLNQMGGRTI
jgi:dTDP-4-dehydrorhamnose reductase